MDKKFTSKLTLGKYGGEDEVVKEFLDSIKAGDRAIITKLLNANPHLKEWKDMDNNSPLHIAVEAPKNVINLLNLLLET